MVWATAKFDLLWASHGMWLKINTITHGASVQPSYTCQAHVIRPPKLEVFHMYNTFNTREILQPAAGVFDV